MVNSGSFDAPGSEGESVKAEFTQLEEDPVPRSAAAASPHHLVGACATEANFTAEVPESETSRCNNAVSHDDHLHHQDLPMAERDDGLTDSITSLLDLDVTATATTDDATVTIDTTTDDSKECSDDGDNKSCDSVTKTSLQCSVPLDKVKNVLELCKRTDSDKSNNLSNFYILENYLKQNVKSTSESAKPNELTTTNTAEWNGGGGDTTQKPAMKRLLCLFCDRTFTSNNLKQKHVDRCHSVGQTRRSSSRTPSHHQSATACCFCSKLNHTDHTLNQLLEHLISEHSNRYFACLACQERFTTVHSLREHNKLIHGIDEDAERKATAPSSSHIVNGATLRDNTTLTTTTCTQQTSELLKRNCNSDIVTRTEQTQATVRKISSPPPNLATKPLKRNSSLKNSTSENNELQEKSVGFSVDFEETIHVNVISNEDIKKNQKPELEIDLSLPGRKSKNDAAKTRNGGKKNTQSNKKICVKSTKNGVRNNLRTTRATVKQINNFNKNRNKSKIVKNNKSYNNKDEQQIVVPKPTTVKATSVFSLVNAYTYKYEKIYDHASDSIKDENSVQFNAVFDKDFYSRTVCNIRDNLLHHMDGKLNRNVESESRISNFEHNPTCVSEPDAKTANEALDNFGCDLSLNAVTPVATLLSSSQYGEDFDSQIEYGAKASQKKRKKVAVVKYKFTNKKYNSLFHTKDKHADLTYLDMWTQLTVKKRQHKCHVDGSFDNDSPFASEFPMGYEAKEKVKELNRILDKRGPFEDLRLEADAAQFFELRKKSKDSDSTLEESTEDVYFILEDLVTKVVKKCNEKHLNDCDTKENIIQNDVLASLNLGKTSDILQIETKEEANQTMDIPNYLQLQRSSPHLNRIQIDKTDKIAMICSSQDENEMQENKLVELSGEWARPRIYICATCGLKLPNLKSLDDHKNASHPQIWCSHYEFVGNQSEIYRHLSIPGLGKVGLVETLPANRIWQKSDARVCSKCSKQCQHLGELHKHILECGGDWTWMLARKKCKYRPYGARTRRRRQRGELCSFTLSLFNYYKSTSRKAHTIISL